MQRFRDNPWDIAGVADLPEDEAALNGSLRRVGAWVQSDGILSEERLGEIMFVLIKVAQEEYGEGGYWPKLRERLGAERLDQRQQEQLGEWFQRGLRLCGYAVPQPRKALVYLTPILMHAGIPRSSQPGLVALINSYRTAYETALPDLEPEIIAQLARTYTGSVHANVRRLLKQQWAGVQALWSAVARVVLAQSSPEDLEQELGLLPPPLDADTVREALSDAASGNGKKQATYFRPRLRYDSQSGEVRLWAPSDRPEDWTVREPDGLRLWWTRDGEGSSAEVFAPLPAEEDKTIADLLLEWPVPGLRWRIKGMTEQLAKWSQQLVQVSPLDAPKVTQGAAESGSTSAPHATILDAISPIPKARSFWLQRSANDPAKACALFRRTP